MKRVIGLVLAAVMTMTVLSGCGGKDSSTGSVAGESFTTVTSQTEKNTNPVTLWINPFLSPDRAEENEAMFKEFSKQFTDEYGVDVNLQVIPWANRDQRMLMAFSAGKGPDVVYLITDHLAQFGTMGVLEPLDKYIPDDQKNDYLDSALKAVTMNGNIYGLPMLITVQPYLYNATLLNNIGWDTSKLPETWEDLDKMFEMAKAKGKYGLLYPGGENGNISFYPWMWQAGGDVLDDSGKVIFNSPETKAAITKLSEWFKKGYIQKDSINLVGNNQVDPIWESGNTCLQIADGSLTANYLSGNKKLNFDVKVGLPVKNKEQAIFGTMGSWSVSATSKNKEAAANLILKMTASENMKLFLEKSGYMPPRKSLENMYDNRGELKTFVESRQYFRTGVLHPAGRAITTTLISPMMQAIFLGKNIDEEMTKASAAMQKAVDDSMSIKTN